MTNTAVAETAPAARWLALAAAPTFALMAVWTARQGGEAQALCAAMRQAPPLGEMTFMYALMSAFHCAPWLLLWGAWRD